MTFIHQTVEGSLKCKDGYIISQNSHFQKGTSYASAPGMIKNILRASFCTKRVTQNNNLYGFEVLFLSLPEVVDCLKHFRRICQRGILLSFVFSCNALYRQGKVKRTSIISELFLDIVCAAINTVLQTKVDLIWEC